MPVELRQSRLCCQSCGQEIAEAGQLLPALDPEVRPVGLAVRECELAGKKTSRYSTCQSFLVNPLPIRFELVLTRGVADKSVTEVGPDATTEHSWFEGRAHRVVVCAGCSCHIGWSYAAHGEAKFYGLATSTSNVWAMVFLVILLCFAAYQIRFGSAPLAIASLCLALVKLAPHFLY
eukprot:TRINITY_DN79323_c0_g1_i1.p1 TRINITY_DN79323_c0_g1~~TRINITY_DN79323_c0_g1_i1.p1  ORF type:complete len:177 (-),score=23.89 TRINITY_DN79323_c0_g1_i1:191-721(-)